ncbi:HesA/MoeB/ThiF family protein [Sphingomonas solaris]|uniref:ThiF family adenylyltransferase n=1 Tax=Alterirhizorhabdus solaris TaxID=2529389 RepID=A0A558R4M6_9SPHN|nr:ThiF family adenylyltransferase [Sphingomonas solaris]TVV74340.1 ThiF family adenylyltransferase [Sphingomonas solaris]
MTGFSLVMQQRHTSALHQALLPVSTNGAPCLVLFGTNEIASDPWDRQRRLRLLSYELAGDQTSAARITEAIARCKAEDLTLGVARSQLTDSAAGTAEIDEDDRGLLKRLRQELGASVQLVSLRIDADGWSARLWPDARSAIAADYITVLGDGLALHGLHGRESADFLARQDLAFGPKLGRYLRGLRVGVVGCGATGSATAMLLARLGVGQLALFDDDIVDVTNLNRLHGARRADADAMRPKVDVLTREITELGLGVRTVSFRGWVGDPAARDALKACDVVFGCTDDHDGRLLLNRFAYFYLVPVIDMGLAIRPAGDGRIAELGGRVTVLAPTGQCLICRKVVDAETARDEALKRVSPEEFERRKREAYVRGGGEPAPAVVTFTTATACMAVDELIQGLTDFRGSGWRWHGVRRFDLLADRRPGAEQDEHCPVCSGTDYWGRGDMQPFLDRIGQ